MEFSKDQIEKAKQCKTVEEFKELAKAEGLNLSQEEIEKYFDATHTGELNDDELTAVAGGTKYSSGIDGPNGFHKYVIVTLYNKPGELCKAHGLDNRPAGNPDHSLYTLCCKDCVNCFRVNITHYCSKRWEGNDPLKK